MFRRYKKDEGAPNRLIDEAEPNKLSWTSADGADADAAEADEFDDVADADDGDADDEPDERTDEERAADLAAELQREAEEYGLTGSDAVQMYGANGDDIAALLDSLAGIDYETAEAIADSYSATPEAELKVAQSVVRRRHRGGEHEAEMWAAEHAVSDWLASLQLSGDDAELYAVVAEAATDAVDALVLEEELADVDFETLYAPWGDIMDVDEDEAGEDAEAEGEPEAAEGSASKSSPKKAAAAATEGAEGAAEAGETAEAAGEEGEFGPNTELVLAFLTRLAALTAAELTELVAAWRRQPKEDLSIAHRNLQALADEDRGWREQMHLAQEEVFAWMNGRNEKRDYSFAVSPSLARVREVAGPAVADAVAALTMADILEAEDAETLYAPWVEAIGEPELPVYEDDDAGEESGEDD